MKITGIIEGKNIPKKEVWINEALFGFHYIEKYFEGFEGRKAVLEVGCGSGILLSMLNEKYNIHEYEGIEPFGSGFSSLAELNQLVKSQGINIHNVGYEDFKTNKQYDLIFCINVFEHLNDWKDFLVKVEKWLSPQGICVILCPNYVIPYESHFKIPILWNKSLTHKIFKNYINRYEAKENCDGLWRSLNFVKLPQVKQFVRKNGLTLKINNMMVEDMVERLSSDREFLARQRFVGGIAIILKKLGILKLFGTKAFENLQPYMMLEMSKKSNDEVV